jgi:pimeloyl-ACP methyl ester carboxylesterase
MLRSRATGLSCCFVTVFPNPGIPRGISFRRLRKLVSAPSRLICVATAKLIVRGLSDIPCCISSTGFRGGLNWYRNIDRNWELLSAFEGMRVTVPALYIAGDRDSVLAFRGMEQIISDLPNNVPKLQKTIVLPGCGHWTQQERPTEVSKAMIHFVRNL